MYPVDNMKFNLMEHLYEYESWPKPFIHNFASAIEIGIWILWMEILKNLFGTSDRHLNVYLLQQYLIVSA